MADYDLTADRTDIYADDTGWTADGGLFVPWTFNPASLRNPGTRLYEIPIIDPPCTFTIGLPGGAFRFRFLYCNDAEGGWTMDIATDGDEPLACGLMVVAGLDLLAAHKHLGLGCRMFVVNPADPSAPIGFDDLGRDARLFFEVR